MIDILPLDASSIQNGKLTTTMRVASFYTATDGERLYLEKYFARAVVAFRKLEVAARRVVFGEVEFVRLSRIDDFSETSILETNYLNESGDARLRRFLPLSATVDLTRGQLHGTFEEIKSPFDFPVPTAKNSEFDFFIKYDFSRRRHGIVVRRAGKYYPPLGTGYIYDDGWIGFKLGWNILSSQFSNAKLACYRYNADGERESVFVQDVALQNQDYAQISRQTLEQIYTREGRYDFELTAVQTATERAFKKTIRVDVTAGFLTQTAPSYIKLIDLNGVPIPEFTGDKIRLAARFLWKPRKVSDSTSLVGAPSLILFAFRELSISLYPTAVRLVSALPANQGPSMCRLQLAYFGQRNNGTNKEVNLEIVIEKVLPNTPAQGLVITQLSIDGEQVSLQGVPDDRVLRSDLNSSGEPIGNYNAFVFANTLLFPSGSGYQNNQGALLSSVQVKKLVVETITGGLTLKLLDLDFENHYASNPDELPDEAVRARLMKWKSKSNGEPDEAAVFTELAEVDELEEVVILDKSAFGKF